MLDPYAMRKSPTWSDIFSAGMQIHIINGLRRGPNFQVCGLNLSTGTNGLGLNTNEQALSVCDPSSRVYN